MRLATRLDTRSLCGVAFAFALALIGVFGLAAPAQSQWTFPGSQRPTPPRGGGVMDFLREQLRRAPLPQQQPGPVDFSRAPPAMRKAPDVAPSMQIVVLGDSLADWLASGLEDAFADMPEFGIARRHRTVSGLIRDERASPFDWVQGAREILNAEKPSFVVMMIGPSDRRPIRERGASDAKPGDRRQAGQRSDQRNPPAQPPQNNAAAATSDQNAERPQEGEPGAFAVQEARTPGGHEFRSEKWIELYSKRIDDTIAVLKSKGVPVLWVGLPSIRGARASTDAVYLNDLYRSRAEKAEIKFIDVWDGFADEAGNFIPQGPDLDGQIRRLRAADGWHFTKAGARKLAHYVEREIKRTLLARGAPMAMPMPDEPNAATRPGEPAPRPVAGPAIPLNAAAETPQDLVSERAAQPDAVLTRVMVHGESLPTMAGRADDFTWPRRSEESEIVPALASPSSVPAVTQNPPSSPPASPPQPPQPPAASKPKPQNQATQPATTPPRPIPATPRG